MRSKADVFNRLKHLAKILAANFTSIKMIVRQVFGLFLLVIAVFAADPSCIDNEGKEVDWQVD